VAVVVNAYKFLDHGGVAPFTGFRWPVGEWVDGGRVDPCRSGIHACRVGDLPVWMGKELWEVELDGEIVERERQVIAQRGRLVRRVDGWTDELLDGFGELCARRTRTRVGHVPVLSGFVGDIDRFISQRRFPIVGFAAARAAELRDGPDAYDEERVAQATWLAENLGLRPESG
jgi:hypothetical protein